jgi:hypothetical protein
MVVTFMSRILCILTVLSLAAMTVAVGADSTTHAVKAADFETLKRMAGEWQLDDPKGTINGTVKYQVTSAGTAVVETVTPGTPPPHEMVTVYTRDGESVAATHYCALGNQPHLVSKAGGPPNQMHFDFVSGGNMKSAKDTHMHSLTVTFLDDNHVKQEWQVYVDGKAGEKTVLMLTRRS